MSGGCFDYRNDNLQTDIFGWGVQKGKVPNVFEDKLISELIFDVFELIHSYDWYNSGDTCEEDYRADVTKFKERWFKSPQKTQKELIDNSIEELRAELYRALEITKNSK